MAVRPAKTQISLGIRAKDTTFLHADSEDSEFSLGAQPHCWFCHGAAQIDIDESVDV